MIKIRFRKKGDEPSLSTKILTIYNWCKVEMSSAKTARLKVVVTSYDKNSKTLAEKEFWVGRTMGLSGAAKTTSRVRKKT